MNILIVDDERQLTEAIAEMLRARKYAVDAVYNGEDALHFAETGIYDVVILDIMLPKVDGITVLKTLRAKKNPARILMLSAKSEIADKVQGLNEGADDYLTKPFSSAELLARVTALARRSSDLTEDMPSLGGTTLDTRSFELCCGDRRVKLGDKEYRLMELLLRNQSRVCTKELMVEKIWGFDFEGEYNTVEVYISFLRKKLGVIGSTIRIVSLRGRGYTLETK